jgi:hypothetical protein
MALDADVPLCADSFGKNLTVFGVSIVARLDLFHLKK